MIIGNNAVKNVAVIRHLWKNVVAISIEESCD